MLQDWPAGCCRGGIRSAGELTREVLDAVDESGQQPVRWPAGADIRHPVQQLAQDGGDLPPGQVRAEAEVRAGGTEADVRVR